MYWYSWKPSPRNIGNHQPATLFFRHFRVFWGCFPEPSWWGSFRFALVNDHFQSFQVGVLILASSPRSPFGSWPWCWEPIVALFLWLLVRTPPKDILKSFIGDHHAISIFEQHKQGHTKIHHSDIYVLSGSLTFAVKTWYGISFAVHQNGKPNIVGLPPRG